MSRTLLVSTSPYILHSYIRNEERLIDASIIQFRLRHTLALLSKSCCLYQAYAMMSPLSPSSFSSLDSPTTSAVPKRKQMVVETSYTKKNEDIPSVLFLGDDASPPSPLNSEVPSSKRLKIDSTPAAATVPTPALNESGMTNNYLEREWALAATRNNGHNAFAAYLTNMTQLSSQQLPQSQQLHPSQQQLAVPQLVTPKYNASFEAYLASVGIQPQVQQRQLPPLQTTQQQVTPKQPKPLTKAKKNKLEAAAMIEEINAINLDDEKDDKDREIYDSCPEVAAKIKQFLKIQGLNRKIFLEGLQMDESYETLKKFIEGIGQNQCRSKVYRRG